MSAMAESLMVLKLTISSHRRTTPLMRAALRCGLATVLSYLMGTGGAYSNRKNARGVYTLLEGLHDNAIALVAGGVYPPPQSFPGLLSWREAYLHPLLGAVIQSLRGCPPTWPAGLCY